MIFVKTCYFLLFILSIHSVWSINYNDKIRIKRLATETVVDEATEPTSHVEAESTTTTGKSNALNSSSRKSKKIDSASFQSNLASATNIPVQVIYDPQPETVTVIDKVTTKAPKSGQRHRKVRRRNQTKHLQGSQKSDLNITQSTSTVKTTTNVNILSQVKDTTKAPFISARTVEKTSTTPSTKQIRERPPVIPIIDSESRVYSHKGEFHYSYESGDGTKAFERTEDKKVDDDGSTNGAVVGGFSYTDKEGNDVSLSYTADENGYRPSGAHLPTPPPIPPAIARALKYLATKSTPDPDSVTGKYAIDY